MKTPKTVKIPLTRGFVTVVDACDADLADRKWTAMVASTGKAYAYRQKTAVERRTSPNRAPVYLHREIATRAGVDVQRFEVDHRSGDTMDCRRANLRAATHAQNMKNLTMRTNTSGIKGAFWFKPAQRWKSSIRVDGRQVHLGYFDTKEAAGEAYAAAAVKYHEAFARI